MIHDGWRSSEARQATRPALRSSSLQARGQSPRPSSGPSTVVEDGRTLLLLEELGGQENVSQRYLAERLGVAVSLVNRLIAQLIRVGHVEVVDPCVRPFAYRLSQAGQEYRRQLQHARLYSVVSMFREVEERIRSCLYRLKEDGIRRVAFYGVGDLMEVTYSLALSLDIDVVGIVDDDPENHGQRDGGFVVGAPALIKQARPDAVVITTCSRPEDVQRTIGVDADWSLRFLEL
jgi:hypothetical protein